MNNTHVSDLISAAARARNLTLRKQQCVLCAALHPWSQTLQEGSWRVHIMICLPLKVMLSTSMQLPVYGH